MLRDETESALIDRLVRRELQLAALEHMPFLLGEMTIHGQEIEIWAQVAVQFAWLAELQRITRAGGLVFLSVQGPTQMAYNSFPPAKYRELLEKGFIDYSPDPTLTGLINDETYYRASMHARHYIVDRWSEFFEVIAIVDAIAAMQDFVVMRRRP
jgi:hypothetical protein